MRRPEERHPEGRGRYIDISVVVGCVGEDLLEQDTAEAVGYEEDRAGGEWLFMFD